MFPQEVRYMSTFPQMMCADRQKQTCNQLFKSTAGPCVSVCVWVCVYVCVCTWMGLRWLAAGTWRTRSIASGKTLHVVLQRQEEGKWITSSSPPDPASLLHLSSLWPKMVPMLKEDGLVRKGAKENTLTHSLPCWVLDALCLGLLSWLCDCFPGPLDGAADWFSLPAADVTLDEAW